MSKFKKLSKSAFDKKMKSLKGKWVLYCYTGETIKWPFFYTMDKLEKKYKKLNFYCLHIEKKTRIFEIVLNPDTMIFLAIDSKLHGCFDGSSEERIIRELDEFNQN